MFGMAGEGGRQSKWRNGEESGGEREASVPSKEEVKRQNEEINPHNHIEIEMTAKIKFCLERRGRGSPNLKGPGPPMFEIKFLVLDCENKSLPSPYYHF